MASADDIAAAVPKRKADAAPDEAEGKPGDHGKRIRAALAMKGEAGDIALENAIKDCVEDASY